MNPTHGHPASSTTPPLSSPAARPRPDGTTSRADPASAVPELLGSIDDATDCIRRGGPGSIARMREHLNELASLASDIEHSLRTAREHATALSDSVDAIASRAYDAERSLRDAGSWAIGFDEQIGESRSRPPR